MKLIMKYLNPYMHILIICMALLLGQAVADLSLPTYMSDIVNIGVQKNGIDEEVPDAISADAMKLVTLFMTENEKISFQNSYSEVDKDSSLKEKYKKTFSKSTEGVYYIKSDLSEDTILQLGDIYGTAILSFVNFAKENAEKHESTDSQTNFEDIDLDSIYSIIPMIEKIPKEQIYTYIEKAESSDKMMKTQVGVVFTKVFYDELNADLDKLQKDYIKSTGMKMLGITLLGTLAAILVGFIAARLSANTAKRLRFDIFSKVQYFANAEFDKFSTASLITRTTNDIQQVQTLVMMGIRMMCFAPIMGIGGVIMAVGKSPSMSWIIVLAVAVLLGISMIVFSVSLPKFKILQKLIDKLNLVSRENLSGMMVIRAFGNEKYEEERFEEAALNLRSTERFVQRIMAFLMPLMIFIMNAVSVLVIWVGAHQIEKSNLQIGDMMAFIQYIMQIIMSFLMIAMMFIMIPRASVSAVRIKEVLDMNFSIKDSISAKKVKKLKGEIEFKNVHFRYENAQEDAVLELNFTAKPGQTTAFIGSTGSGKTTLVNLIPRFYDVTRGYITIDGMDIRDIDQKSLRDNIGYIPQKGVLFTGTINSNVSYGKENANLEEINTAIKVAQASDFVKSTPSGLNTFISQGGSNVSGGQKQRLAIARALVKKPSIYIFDDSFSALDFKTDRQLRQDLKEFTGESTVLIVAQRVNTIVNAEQIIVLDEGQIVGKGTHRELLENCSVYREIAESQLSKEELA
jgi:ATP-binding cassette, subfamily B, multidrug efflux pump